MCCGAVMFVLSLHPYRFSLEILIITKPPMERDYQGTHVASHLSQHSSRLAGETEAYIKRYSANITSYLIPAVSGILQINMNISGTTTKLTEHT